MPKNNATKVVIVERDGGFFVQPAAVVLEKENGGNNHDKLRIFNATKQDALFRLEGVPNGPFGNVTILEEIKAGGKSAVRQLDNAVGNGPFSYQIFMLEDGVKAKGNSDPVIIIEN